MKSSSPSFVDRKRFLLLSSSVSWSICVLIAAALIIFLAALTIPNLGLGFSPPLELLLIQGRISASQQSPGNLSNTAAPPPEQAIDRSITDRSCDLYTGQWIFDPARRPLYGDASCPMLSQAQNCQRNGRPDREYALWRWVPHGCDLAGINTTEFFRIMRGKVIAFVGDSLARNHMESLMCILMQAETPINRGNRKMQRWFFPSSSVTIVRIWSSWLVRFTSGDASVRNATRVHIDQADGNFMDFLPKVDVLIISSGHWFVKKSAFVRGGEVVGAQGWRRKGITNKEAFAESTRTALNAILSSPGYKGLTVLRTFSPDHYMGGSWNTGGSCTGATKPLTEEQVKEHANLHTRDMRRIQLEVFAEAQRNAGNTSRLVLMDVTPVFDYRADGHPSVFRGGPDGKVQAQDCLHWCMPGPVDTWNEFLFHILKHNMVQ